MNGKPAADPTILVMDTIRKSFGDVRAVDDVSLAWCYVTVSPKGKWEGAAGAVDPLVAALPPAEYKVVVEEPSKVHSNPARRAGRTTAGA